jgi:AbrB family looped-hinge helix DNA binding protein
MQDTIKINERGVITIPAAFREALGLRPNDTLIIEETDLGLLLRPAVSVPIEIYTEQRIAEFAREEEEVGRILSQKGRSKSEASAE